MIEIKYETVSDISYGILRLLVKLGKHGRRHLVREQQLLIQLLIIGD